MRFVTYAKGGDGAARVGVERDGRIFDLGALLSARGEAPPVSLLELIRANAPARASIEVALSGAGALRFSHAAREVRLLAPIPRPGKVLCSGINYHSHLKENPAAKLPDEPFFFAKMPSAVIGPETPIVIPTRSRQVDYEVEFAAVIGRTLRRAAESDVMPAIFGYTILHDVSARDVQFKDNQITLGKNFDTFCPMGPYVVTADEIPHPEALALRSRVNGELRQNGSNRDWVFSLPRLLSELSHVMTLEPGDIVSTGTPAGVGLFRKPPVYLKGGDIVEVEVLS